ncbi:MAG: hypothetical protein P8R54_12975 [Myxococcota bacterium]|nr:hypothetical protein [Myxococcota bacterium]
MPIRDILAAALSRPAGRVVDGPVRDIVNEILADHGYASPAELAALKADADGLRGRLGSVDARLAELESAAVALQESVDALRAELANRPAEPATGPRPSLIPQVPEPPTEPLGERQTWAERSVKKGMCKVLNCNEEASKDGFCAKHASDWSAGRLPGFISPEGLVSVAGEPRLVDPALSGLAYAVEGNVVEIDGRQVPTVGY